MHSTLFIACSCLLWSHAAAWTSTLTPTTTATRPAWSSSLPSSHYTTSTSRRRLQLQPLRSANDAASSSSGTPKPGDVVTIECRLEPEGDFVPEALIDGVVLRSEDPATTLSFVLGAGNYLPGLHDLVAGLVPGGSCEKVSLDAGWGARNPDLVGQANYADSGLDSSQISVGVELQLANGMKCIVTDMDSDSSKEGSGFTIDANPPLAGASYLASVKLLKVEEGPTIEEYQEESDSSSRFAVATFALGCFWGGELEYMREPGVVGTSVGYTHGDVLNPTYEQVCSGTTGHTESMAVIYDPEQVSYERLVHLALNRLEGSKYLLNQVGNDKGTQYRHGVYYHNALQKQLAEDIVGSYGPDCVTECLPAKKYWIAEPEHQQYLLKGGQGARKDDKSVIRCYG
jgi:peptide-methionine (S)-S-oxide reductase